jgi:uncharacterized protein YuzE
MTLRQIYSTHGWNCGGVIEAGDNVIVKLDEKGRIMGIEIWNASKRGVMEKRALIAKSLGLSLEH